MDSNHRPSGYEPDELPLLHAASSVLSFECSVLSCHSRNFTLNTQHSKLNIPRSVGRTDLLSQRSGASTFGAATFHDPVRDGSGWCHRAPRTPLAQGSCRPLCRFCFCFCLAQSCPPRVSPRKPSPMRTPRLYWSPSLQPAPLSQSSPGGLTPLKGRVSSSWGAIPT